MTLSKNTGLVVIVLFCLSFLCTNPIQAQDNNNPLTSLNNVIINKSSTIDAAKGDLNVIKRDESAANKPCTLAILSDLHVCNENLEALQKVISEINSLAGIFAVALLGDLCKETGTKKEYATVIKAVSHFSIPILAIPGNHDFMYRDVLSKDKKKIRGQPADKKAKLEYFRKALKQPALRFTKKVGGHLLVFLPIDALDAKPLAKLSDTTIHFLRQTLEENPKLPTIIFCHAPLEGSYESERDLQPLHADAQPAATIKSILRDNKQVFLWVAGHLHIKPSAKDYFSSANKVGNVTVIHIPAIKATSSWVHTIRLSPESAVVRTYDPKTHKFVKKFDRTFRHKVGAKTSASNNEPANPSINKPDEGQVKSVEEPAKPVVEPQKTLEKQTTIDHLKRIFEIAINYFKKLWSNFSSFLR